MSEKNLKDRYIDKFLNIKFFAIAAILIAFIISLSSIKNAIINLFPNPKKEYCSNESNTIKKLSSTIVESQIDYMDFGKLLELENNVHKIIKFQQEEKRYDCKTLEDYTKINYEIKDKLLSITFSNVDRWHQSPDSKHLKEMVRHLCQLNKYFSNKIKIYSPKELETINSTITIVE